MKERKLGLAKILSSTCRYIDICVINYKFFDKLIPRIYPESQIADKSSNDESVVLYLDVLEMEIIVLVQTCIIKLTIFVFLLSCIRLHLV